MPMKCKMLLCVLALLVLPAAAFAADVTVYSESFDGSTVPAYGLQGSWGIGAPAKGAVGGPSAAFSATKVLGYNLVGLYNPNISPAQYATTPAINCSGKVGVRLSFQRWLRVEDSYFDKATVEVSSDATTWTTLWTNPSEGKAADSTLDLLDTGWNLVSFDISSVADNKATVYVRWGLSSNSLHDFAGWSIDDVKVVATANEALYTIAPAGTTLPAGMVTSDPAIWQVGAAVAGGGQLHDADGDPGTPDVLEGADPATNAAGVAGGSVIGTVIGGNYPGDGVATGMLVPAYLTWGPLDMTGRTGVKLEFQRSLGVEDSKYDRVRIEAANTLELVQVAKDTSAVTLDKATKSKVYPMNTTGYFNDVATVKYVVSGLAAGESVKVQYTLDNTAGTPVWVDLSAADTTNTPADTVETFTSAELDALVSDNAKFALRVLLTTASDTSTAKVVISEASLKGILWTVVYQNPTGGAATTSNVFDTAWTLVSYNLSAIADNKATVYVRWSVGPTDEFPNSNYGGWSLDAIALTAGSREWAFVSETAPAALLWGASGAASVVAKNTGTATWDTGYKLFNVDGVKATIADPANPGKTLSIVDFASAAGVLDRWGVPTAGLAVSGTVAPDATFTFNTTLKAPALTSVVYDLTKPISGPADPALSMLSADFNMASPTPALAKDWLPRYLGLSIANAGVVTSRFADVQPGTAGNWARYWIEELAGRSPMIVQGFTPTEYRPAVAITRDQIAVFIARARGLDQSNPTGLVFHDIPRTYWAAGAIEACAAAGVVSGFPDLSYQPTLVIKRDAMAKFIALGAQYGIVPAPTSMTTPGWFKDVQVVDDPATSTVDERNTFRDFINTLRVNDVVQGYVDGTANPPYHPEFDVTRDQLAVYVWRAFMRITASAVVLGGPGITAVDVPAAQYSGFVDAPSLVQTGEQYFAYVTFDALRFSGNDLVGLLGGGFLDVTFTLAEAHGITAANVSQTVQVPAADIATWIADLSGAGATGEPYRNVAWAIPTGLQGQYNLEVTVESGAPLARKPVFNVMAQMYSENFDSIATLLNWTLFGQPGTGAKIYPLYLTDPATGVADLFKGAGSLELQGTQQVVRMFDTSNRHDIRLIVSLAATGLGASDAVKVEWANDANTKGLAGATWVTVYNQAGTAVPSKLTEQTFNLPNGNPTADPVTHGADNEAGFAVRLSITATAAAARAYFDDLSIRGD